MTELWTPMAFTAKEAENHGGHYVAAIGKLKPGVTLDQASTEMSTIAGRLAAQFPEANTGWNVNHTVARVLGQNHQTCLARPPRCSRLCPVDCLRQRRESVAGACCWEAAEEIATRTALGAGRWRIIRQLLTESMLLSLAGGAVGLLLAKWGTDLLLTLARRIYRA